MTAQKKTPSKKTAAGRSTTGRVAAARTGNARTGAAKSGAARSHASAKPNRAAGEGNDVRVIDEIIIIAALLVSLLLVLSYFDVCGMVGDWLNTVVFGLFGVFGYVFPFALFFGVLFGVSNRGNKRAVRRVIFGAVMAVFIMALLQITIGGYNEKLKILDYFTHSELTYAGSIPAYGGLFGGMICMLLCPFVGNVAAVCICIAAVLIFFMLMSGKALFALVKDSMAKRRVRKDKYEDDDEVLRPREEEYIEAHDYFNDDDIPRRRIRLQSPVVIEKMPSGDDVLEQEDEDFIEHLKKRGKTLAQNEKNSRGKKNAPETVEEAAFELEEISKKYRDDDSEAGTEGQESIYNQELAKKYGGKKLDVPNLRRSPYADSIVIGRGDAAELFDDSTDQTGENGKIIRLHGYLKEPEDGACETAAAGTEGIYEADMSAAGSRTSEDVAAAQKNANQPTEELEIKHEEPKKYTFPPITLLNKSRKNTKGVSEKEMRDTAKKLEAVFESFGVGVTVTDVSCGPTVTRYELHPEQGVKVSRITGLADDIKLNLATADIRIEAPIPGKAAVGIEVPNRENTAVLLRDLLESDEFARHASKIAFAVGKDIAGKTVVTDIAKMPHLLIAGATGSGKSVCINTLIMSIIYKASPYEVKLIMVDPKVVELNVYNGIPHLLIPVVTDPKKAAAALNWAVVEMTNRYKIFAEMGVRDLTGYNEKVDELAYKPKTSENEETVLLNRLPQIVIIVDELADLMMVAPGEVEDAICRLAQLARAAGIHLIIATQRPSVNVITGLIKANIPSRVAFAVSSAIDSRTIIDSGGAEKLLGRGDMLFFPSGYPKPVRLQGAFVSDKEVNAVVDFLKSQTQSEETYSEEIVGQIESVEQAAAAPAAGNDRDEYFADAARFIIEKDKASIGMLQRVYKIGFNRAARIMDQLCEAGVVGPEEGTKPRRILMTAEEFESFIS